MVCEYMCCKQMREHRNSAPLVRRRFVFSVCRLPRLVAISPFDRRHLACASIADVARETVRLVM